MKNDATVEKNDLGSLTACHKITPEMIEDGVSCLKEIIDFFEPTESELKLAVIAVFLVMDKARNELIAEIKGKKIEVNPEMISRASDWFETNIA